MRAMSAEKLITEGKLDLQSSVLIRLVYHTLSINL